jgi:hypothetical protein
MSEKETREKTRFRILSLILDSIPARARAGWNDGNFQADLSLSRKDRPGYIHDDSIVGAVHQKLKQSAITTVAQVSHPVYKSVFTDLSLQPLG